MAYVEPTQVVTGAPITAAKWNQDVVDNTLALYNSPGVLLRRDSAGVGTNQNVPQSENTLIIPTSTIDEIYRAGVTVNTGEGTFTVEYAGVYSVGAYVQFESTTSANNGVLYASASDGQFIASRTYQHPAIGGGHIAYLAISGLKYLSAGAYVQFYVRQNLIANQLVSAYYLGLHWIGSGV